MNCALEAETKAEKMVSGMKLYEISWGIYPRRVGIYLAEKGITDIERIDIAVTPQSPQPLLGDTSIPGTVPALDTGKGMVIGSSIAIMEYLEELYPDPNLLGQTALERARTREIVSVIEEATIYKGIWVRNSSPLFSFRNDQNIEGGKVVAMAYYRALRMLDKYAAASDGPFVAGKTVTIADCISYATIQFANSVYGLQMPEECSALRGWFERFAQRPSAAIPHYPQEALDLAQGLHERTFPD
jgi:glutathione S-transferase